MRRVFQTTIGRKSKQNKSLYRFGMNKKKFAVLALLMIALVVLSSAMLVACNKNGNNNDSDNKTTTIEATKGLLISNGDFKVVDTSVKTYPRTLTSWTGGKTYSSGNYKDDVTAGAISLDKALYDANKSKWDDNDDTLYNKLIAGADTVTTTKSKTHLWSTCPRNPKRTARKCTARRLTATLPPLSPSPRAVTTSSRWTC